MVKFQAFGHVLLECSQGPLGAGAMKRCAVVRGMSSCHKFPLLQAVRADVRVCHSNSLKCDQTAVTPTSAPQSGPDVSVCRAISISFLQAVLCSDLTIVNCRHAKILHPHNQPKAVMPEATTGQRHCKLRLGVIPTTN
eukprot:462212-Rhodomonas_salina.2